MSQSRTICHGSSVGFGSSGERSSSFKAWPGLVLLRWFHKNDSQTSARLSKPTGIDSEVDPGKTELDDARSPRARLQELIARAYAEMMARRDNR